MKNHHTPKQTVHWAARLAVLLALTVLISGCCSFNSALYAQLGKTKTDVAKAYDTAAAGDVATARKDVADLVALAQKDKQKCPEPHKQAENIKGIFDGTDFARKGSKINQHKKENIGEAIDLAIATQDNLKK